jgi:hypothetical protein
VSSVTTVIVQDFRHLSNGDSIYICSSALFDFVTNYLPNIRVKFVLVTGDSDSSIPGTSLPELEFRKLMHSPLLIAWFSQNLIASPNEYPKFRYLPIGLDYHTLSERDYFWGPKTVPKIQEQLLYAVSNKAKPFYLRKPIAYSTFHFELDRGDRHLAYKQIPKELIFYEPKKNQRLHSWKHQTEYAFVVSPPGEGLDCHRTWEAMCLGCIPILISTPLDDLFEGLPVLIVKSWEDITAELLNNTIEEYKTRTFNLEKLELKYWVNEIKLAGSCKKARDSSLCKI